jgi:hypothetical protein
MNAKKLDFDFGDTDDFFNTFDANKATKVDTNTFGNEFSMDPVKEQRKGKSNKL